MPFFEALAWGLLAGLAVAMPLGAIGVLLVQEGASRGVRGAIPAALAVGSVDTAYCATTVASGAALAPLVRATQPWPALLGGSLLIAIAVRGLRSSFACGDVSAHTGHGPRRYVIFFGLTAVNPATVVYFGSLLAGTGPVTQSASTASGFVAGVAIGSMSWQFALITLGAVLGRSANPRLRTITLVVGNGLVALFGLVLLVRALAAAS